MVSLRKLREIYPYGYFVTPKSEGFVRQYFSIMTKGKITPAASESDVIPAMVCFLEGAAQREELHELPTTVQEMITDILDTELGDDINYRRRMLSALSLSMQLSTHMHRFPYPTIINACQSFKR